MNREIFWGVFSFIVSLILVYFVYFYYGNGKSILSVFKESNIHIEENNILLKENISKDINTGNITIGFATSGNFNTSGNYNRKIDTVNSGFEENEINDSELSENKNENENENETIKRFNIAIYPINTGEESVLIENNKSLYPPFLFLDLDNIHISGYVNVLSGGKIVSFWSTGLNCTFFMEKLGDYFNIKRIKDEFILKKNKFPGKEVCFLNIDDYKNKFVFWGVKWLDKWLWFKLPISDYYKLKLKLYKSWKYHFKNK